MFAIGRKSQKSPGSIRLVMDKNVKSPRGDNTCAILMFVTKEEAEHKAKQMGDWFFVVPLDIPE